jgi:hypothetical protein
MKKVSSAKEIPQREASSGMRSPHKLKILFTVVNRPKTEFYVDLIQTFEANVQLILSATGTANAELLNYLGLNSSEKSVIISIIRDDREKELLSTLDERFKTIRNGKGIAYTIPMSSTIGVAIYQFLSNTK